MGTIKRAARQAKGKAKEAVLGDGKLQAEATAEQRNSEEDAHRDPCGPKPLGNLSRLT